MPRASKVKSSDERKVVFYMIVGVAFVALVANVNDFIAPFAERIPSAITAEISSSVDTAAPKAAEAEAVPDIEPHVVIDPSDKLPQCDFRSNVKNIVYGQPVRFYWECAQAGRCQLDGAGSVPVSNKDGTEISPRRSAKYQLKCDNSEGSRSFSLDIGVFEFVLREINSTVSE